MSGAKGVAAQRRTEWTRIRGTRGRPDAPLPTSQPLRIGLPFPRGARRSLADLVPELSGGKILESGWRVLAAWPDGSVKWALSRIAPLPRASAAWRCSFPSTRDKRRTRSFELHQLIAVSNSPIPRLRKCARTSLTRSAAESSGKHRSMLRSAVRRNEPGKRYTIAPTNRPNV